MGMGSDKELRVGRDGKYQFYMEIYVPVLFVYPKNPLKET